MEGEYNYQKQLKVGVYFSRMAKGGGGGTNNTKNDLKNFQEKH